MILASIGYHSLALALVLAAYATIVFFLAGKKNAAPLYKSARRAVYAMFGLVTVASMALFHALFSRDFSLQYVAQYSNRALSWFYTGAAFWAGQAGSLLFWGWLLVIFAVVVLRQNRKRNPQLLPYTMAVLSFVTFFFLYLLVFKSNPFEHNMVVPPDGRGLNPLLQNPGMIFHPPSLYVGFVGFTVPFAFAAAALLTGKLDVQWVKSIRRWTLFSWLFLTIGNILGMQWAYVELGWGGYWGWDPVENASLLPWLTGTAFLHSIIVQERKGMLKTWNMSLVALTFALTIFGTFVTRSGLISSVHAFGVSELGPLFLGFLGIIVAGSLALIVYRSNELRDKKSIGAWSSKEMSFLLNNLLFMALTAGVFIGTIMPALSELLRGEKMSVTVDFFNRMATPIALAILLLIGICTLLSWSFTSLKKFAANIAVPGIMTFLSIPLLYFIGVRQIKPMPALIFTLFAFFVTLTEYIRGVIFRRKIENTGFFRALYSLTVKNKRRYGGYIVHFGVILFFFGIAGSSSFSRDNYDTVKPGGAISIGPYELVYNGLNVSRQKDLQIHKADLEVIKNGVPLGSISSEKHIHPNFQPATEVGIRSGPINDLYVILANYDLDTQAATIHILINPLVLWIWIGGFIMVAGVLIAMVPKRR